MILPRGNIIRRLMLKHLMEKLDAIPFVCCYWACLEKIDFLQTETLFPTYAIITKPLPRSSVNIFTQMRRKVLSVYFIQVVQVFAKDENDGQSECVCVNGRSQMHLHARACGREKEDKNEVGRWEDKEKMEKNEREKETRMRECKKVQKANNTQERSHLDRI